MGTSLNELVETTKDLLTTIQANVGLSTLGVGAATALAYYLSLDPKIPKPVLDINCQSVESKHGGRTIPKYKDNDYMGYLFEDVQTLYECFQRGLKISRHEKCLGTRKGKGECYGWVTYQQVQDRAHAFGSGLIKLGLSPGPQTMVGIYTANRVEWVTSEQACNMYSMVIVALYDTLGPDACKYIINLTEMETVICDTAKKVQSLLDQIDQLPSLKRIILMEEISNNNLDLAKSRDIGLYTYQDVELLGSKDLQNPVPPSPDDLTTISFTSGTTGDPKGVMLTHRNLISHISGIFSLVMTNYTFGTNDCHISYLPLSHMFERAMQINAFMHGYHVGFYGGDVKQLFDDIKELQPTIFPTVPRLLNRFYDKIIANCQGYSFKSILLSLALNRKTAEVRRGVVRANSIWDYLVFNKIRKLTGGNIKLLVTASAPLSDHVMTFTRAVFGCMVFEAYGQTEATAAVTCTLPGDITPGHVGAPTLCNSIKLKDVPEMGYFAANDQGEICVKGLSVFQGYYKNPEKTAEVLEPSGWLHTGDIGMWLPKGQLKIIDRKKHIFKLAQGEYVAPEKIENAYSRSQYVAQIYVDGNSLQAYCMAVVTLDMEVMESKIPVYNLPTDIQELCRSQKTKDLVLKDMLNVGKQSGLKGFEQVKDIYINTEPFSVENGLLTPTFKNVRPKLRTKFVNEIEALYKKHQQLK
ncbi:hypothetical protein LOTGIDRAFT_211037 [Lottia gigantea]|uniref:Long-chain-fatty-acid--CoA ligase n=1 Tax=Lottia gigantea TaxID=225164 RepID=V4B6E5_LOTGI|nr:hypothetical protein LOTGIDRAFT_211037 [Lottia gigantea]ESO84094.1 hypothetical protein LOTGIDRAFT_211037 [Lottia gigantea]